MLPEAGLRDLHNLAELSLTNMELTALPPHVMRALPHLTALHLDENLFPTIPPGVTELRQLHFLTLCSNVPLQLSHGCLGVLRGLPSLRRLAVNKGIRASGIWSMDCFETMMAIRLTMPDLELSMWYPV